MSIQSLKSQVLKRYPPVAWVMILAIWGALAAGFMELAEDIWNKEGFAWDAPVMLFIHSFSRPWLDSIMVLISKSGGGWSALFFILLLLWLKYKNQNHTALAAGISFLGATLINGLLKLLFTRPRPTIFMPLEIVNSYSFPSGHTVTAVTMYGFLAFVLWQNSRGKLALLTILWACLIALSRIYLGVHYPSDVLGAIAIGGIWLMGVIIGMNYYPSQAVP